MIKVLVVDDSAVVRKILSEVLNRDGIKVVATANDPYEARERIVQTSPDVVTLDLEMPRMDGLSFLDKLMRYRPLPVVVVSSLTPKGSDEAMRALELGAVEVVSKPGSSFTVGDLGPVLVRAIRAAAASRVARRRDAAATAAQPAPPLARTTAKVLAIGASTGGTEAIRAVLEGLPADTPGMVIVQHMPRLFTSAFARRLDEHCAMRVDEARGGEELLPGLAFVAPGDRHLAVARSGARYVIELRDGPAVNYQRPSIDVTMASVAEAAGGNAMGVILTGMGSDGAAGLLAMRQAGARTLAQDEGTSVVYGMPKAATTNGAAEAALPLNQISGHIIRCLNEMAQPADRGRPA